MGGFRVVHLDDVEAIPGPGTLTWRPVRAHLGVRAFGTNAYTAASAGEDVVEPHTEERYGHEELYFVARGRATFTLDGEEIDAPAGTYVHLADPAVHRHAVAAEPGTTVLSFGGPPTFTPSAWEWAMRAEALADEDLARARAVVEDGLAAHPDAPGLRLWRAKLAARAGEAETARRELGEALARAPALRDDARADEDLGPLLS